MYLKEIGLQSSKLSRDQDLVEPSCELEQLFHQWKREAILFPHIPKIAEDQENLALMAEEKAAYRIVREVAIPLPTNLTSLF